MHGKEQGTLGSGPAVFVTTAWTVVMAAAREGAPGADESLDLLCRTYWKPIHAFVLHRSGFAQDAEDLTQEFFGQLIADQALRRADRTRGRFRSFLLGALRRFLADHAVRRSAQRRGSGCDMVSLDALDDAQLPVAGDEGAESAFEVQWARSLLDSTLAELRAWCAAEGAGARFETLRLFLPGSGGTPPSYQDAALELGMNLPALKSLIHRLRTRYREVLRRQVAITVDAPHEIDDEIRHLLAVTGRLAD